MGELKRKWNRLPEYKRQKCIGEIIEFFERERDEQIGVIAAGQILDIFLQSAGRELYNQGIEDTRKALGNRVDELMLDLDDLIDYD